MSCRPRFRCAASTNGFTLIELLVVLVILAVLISIAVPSYLGFKGRASDRASQANLRATLPAAEAHYSDRGTYVGMDVAALRLIDGGLSSTLVVVDANSSDYCISASVGSSTWSMRGPGTPAPSYVPNGSCS